MLRSESSDPAVVKRTRLSFGSGWPCQKFPRIRAGNHFSCRAAPDGRAASLVIDFNRRRTCRAVKSAGRHPRMISRTPIASPLLGVIFVLVRELLPRENLVLLRQELIQRRTLGESQRPLAGVGEREQGALVVDAADHQLGFGHEKTILRFEPLRERDRRMPCHIGVPIPSVIRGLAVWNPVVAKK